MNSNNTGEKQMEFVTVLDGSVISQNDMDKNLSGGESLFE